MSHFTVMVIGEDFKGQLAPYQENNMGDCPEEYLEFVEDEDCDKDKKTGKHGYWENPNAKWDWYRVGGRWTGYFKLKKGCEGNLGAPGLMTSEAEKGRADQARKGDIDFEAMREEAAFSEVSKYDIARTLMGDAIKTFIPWSKMRDEIYQNNIELARKKYHEQDAVKALAGHQEFFFANIEDFAKDRETFINQVKDSAISSYAVIKDGKWYQKGDMGWFGISSNEKEGHSWNKEFSELLDNLPDDTILTVVDCHI